VLQALPPQVDGAVVVVHHGRELVEARLAAWAAQGLLPCPTQAVDQGEPLGTGHAVAAATRALDEAGADRVVILCGDVPLIRASTVVRLAQSAGLLLAMDLEDPAGYGRVLQKADGSLEAIVEHKDAGAEVRRVRRVNGGAYALPWPQLKLALSRLSRANAQGEYYLTDAVVDVAGQTPVAVELCPAEELMGMNSRQDQAQLQAYAQARVNRHWMDEGVTFLAPDTALVGPRVELARDVRVDPGVRLEGAVTVGEGTTLGQGSVLSECAIGPGVEIRPYCVIHGSQVAEGCVLGPFAHLREGSVLEEAVHVGNFVETKKAVLHQGAKANHLSYLGDAEVGARSNIGAGFISCNYDGFNKHRTVIGEGVFVGSDCQVVAPATLGDGCVIGAGSTITADVPPGALALTRAACVVKEGGADRLRERLRKRP